MIIYQAAPVQQLEHGLIAEDGLPVYLRVLRDHVRACSQLDGLVCLCPCHRLQPDLLHQTKTWAWTKAELCSSDQRQHQGVQSPFEITGAVQHGNRTPNAATSMETVHQMQHQFTSFSPWGFRWHSAWAAYIKCMQLSSAQGSPSGLP